MPGGVVVWAGLLTGLFVFVGRGFCVRGLVIGEWPLFAAGRGSYRCGGLL